VEVSLFMCARSSCDDLIAMALSSTLTFFSSWRVRSVLSHDLCRHTARIWYLDVHLFHHHNPTSTRPTTANLSINQNRYRISRFPLISLFTNRQDFSRSRKDSHVSARCYEVVVMSSGSTTLSSSSMRFEASTMYKRFIMPLLKLPLHCIYTHFRFL